MFPCVVEKLKVNTSPNNVHVLKNRRRLKLEPGMHVGPDQTPLQRECYASLRRTLKERTENGESDLAIRYMRGLPAIVKQETKPPKNQQ